MEAQPPDPKRCPVHLWPLSQDGKCKYCPDKTSDTWELSENDKKFLRSIKIDPDKIAPDK